MLPTSRHTEWLYLPQPVKEIPHRNAHSPAQPRLLLLVMVVAVPACVKSTVSNSHRGLLQHMSPRSGWHPLSWSQRNWILVFPCPWKNSQERETNTLNVPNKTSWMDVRGKSSLQVPWGIHWRWGKGDLTSSQFLETSFSNISKSQGEEAELCQKQGWNWWELLQLTIHCSFPLSIWL